MVKRMILSLVLAVSLVGVMSVGVSAKWKEDANKNRSWIEKGVIAKGWKQINEKWYNFRSDGVMQTGWLMDNGNWYYFWSDGTMAHDTWLTNGGFWYYFDKDGKMVTKSIVVRDREYDFTEPAIIISTNAIVN
jgi:glucan-binding YG repeat protein